MDGLTSRYKSRDRYILMLDHQGVYLLTSTQTWENCLLQGLCSCHQPFLVRGPGMNCIGSVHISMRLPLDVYERSIFWRIPLTERSDICHWHMSPTGAHKYFVECLCIGKHSRLHLPIQLQNRFLSRCQKNTFWHKHWERMGCEPERMYQPVEPVFCARSDGYKVPGAKHVVRLTKTFLIVYWL